MHGILIMLLATIWTAGIAAAQTSGRAGDTASKHTEVEANVVGPQDSIGTAGSSPTKSMLQKRREADSKSSGTSGDSSRRAAPGTFKAPAATGSQDNPGSGIRPDSGQAADRHAEPASGAR